MSNVKSLDNLYAHLRNFHLSDSLYNIGVITSCFKYGANNLVVTEIPLHLHYWITGMSQKERLTMILSASRLSRFLLLSGANDQANVALQLETGTLTQAMDMAMELYDTDVEKGTSNALDKNRLLARIGQWQFSLQDNVNQLLGRGYLLFVELAKRHSHEYNIDEKMREFFGLDAFQYMATGITIWLKTAGSLENDLLIEVPGMQGIVTDESQAQFGEIFSGTATDYKKMMRGETGNVNKVNEIYGMDPLLRIPAIKVEYSNTLKSKYVVPQSKYLYHAISSGMFHLLAFKEQQIAKRKGNLGENQFRRAFGFLYREYVGLQLGLGANKLTVIDLDAELNEQVSLRKPDFAIIDGKQCLLVEVKTSLLNVAARSYFDETALRNEVQSGSFKKAINQLTAFKSAILEGEVADARFQGIEKVILLLLGYEDIFVLNAVMLPLMEEYYGSVAKELQLGCISDIDAIGTYIHEASDIVTAMLKKSDDQATRYDSLAPYFERKCKKHNPVTDQYADTFFSRLL